MSQALSANSVLHAHDTVSEERRALEWFWEVARNFNQDLIRRIQDGVTTPEDIDGSPKVLGAIAYGFKLHMAYLKDKYYSTNKVDKVKIKRIEIHFTIKYANNYTL